MLSPDTGACLRFLRRWAPGGPWALTSINPEKRTLQGRVFRPGDENDLTAWVDVQNVECNVYFHINTVRGTLPRGKANREDIQSMDWCHVDIDPRSGGEYADVEAFDAERARLLATFDHLGNLPPPTVIVDSGGGYQAFWKLVDPIPVNGDTEEAEEAKRYNIQIETELGGDNCHNIDRIARLPGTINRLDKKKRRQGRPQRMAQIVRWDDSLVYPLSEFRKSPKTSAPAGSGMDSATPAVEISGNIKRVMDLDELNELCPGSVSDTIKTLIAQGDTNTGEERYASRSEAVFAVCCALVRAGAPDDVIYSILTDPDWRISESILENRSRVDRDAKRQIQRAKEFAIDPLLTQLNDKHAVISNMGGKCRVIEEIHDSTLNRTRLTVQTFADFKNRYSNKKVEIGVDKEGQSKFAPLGAWWLGQENRRQFDTIVFEPAREVKGAYNMWRGFACDARPGDCSLYMELVRDIICGGNEDWFKYLWGWMARTVQQPAQPGQVAVVLRGEQGIGKGVFITEFGKLWGRHFLQVTNAKHLTGAFNYHLKDCVVLFGDEAFYAGNKQHTEVLKTMITENIQITEAKGVDAEVSANYMHLMLASNNEWVLPADLKSERRLFVLDVATTLQGDRAHWAKLIRQMDNGGREALLHSLMTYDLSSYEVRDVPWTPALRDQKELSMSVIEEWWFTKLQDAEIVPGTDWCVKIRKNAIQEDYFQYYKDCGQASRGAPSKQKLGRFLSRAIPGGCTTVRQSIKNEGQHRFYRMPTLAECRQHWDDDFGGPYEWPKESE